MTFICCLLVLTASNIYYTYHTFLLYCIILFLCLSCWLGSSLFIIRFKSLTSLAACLYFAMIAKAWLASCLKYSHLLSLRELYTNTTKYSGLPARNSKTVFPSIELNDEIAQNGALRRVENTKYRIEYTIR